MAGEDDKLPKRRPNLEGSKTAPEALSPTAVPPEGLHTTSHGYLVFDDGPLPEKLTPEGARDVLLAFRRYKEEQARKAAPPVTHDGLIGVWRSPDGATELTLDINGLFARACYSNITWGNWSLKSWETGENVLSLKIDGIFPAKFYGPMGDQDLVKPDAETMGVVSTDGGVMTLSDGGALSRVQGLTMKQVADHVAQLRLNAGLEEQRNRMRAREVAGQAHAARTVQDEIQRIIDSGSFRFRSR